MFKKSLVAIMSSAILTAGPLPLTAAAQTVVRGPAAGVTAIPAIGAGINSPLPGGLPFIAPGLTPSALAAPSLLPASIVPAPSVLIPAAAVAKPLSPAVAVGESPLSVIQSRDPSVSVDDKAAALGSLFDKSASAGSAADPVQAGPAAAPAEQAVSEEVYALALFYMHAIKQDYHLWSRIASPRLDSPFWEFVVAPHSAAARKELASRLAAQGLSADDLKGFSRGVKAISRKKDMADYVEVYGPYVEGGPDARSSLGGSPEYKDLVADLKNAENNPLPKEQEFGFRLAESISREPSNKTLRWYLIGYFSQLADRMHIGTRFHEYGPRRSVGTNTPPELSAREAGIISRFKRIAEGADADGAAPAVESTQTEAAIKAMRLDQEKRKGSADSYILPGVRSIHIQKTTRQVRVETKPATIFRPAQYEARTVPGPSDLYVNGLFVGQFSDSDAEAAAYAIKDLIKETGNPVSLKIMVFDTRYSYIIKLKLE